MLGRRIFILILDWLNLYTYIANFYSIGIFFFIFFEIASLISIPARSESWSRGVGLDTRHPCRWIGFLIGAQSPENSHFARLRLSLVSIVVYKCYSLDHLFPLCMCAGGCCCRLAGSTRRNRQSLSLHQPPPPPGSYTTSNSLDAPHPPYTPMQPVSLQLMQSNELQLHPLFRCCCIYWGFIPQDILRFFFISLYRLVAMELYSLLDIAVCFSYYYYFFCSRAKKFNVRLL